MENVDIANDATKADNIDVGKADNDGANNVGDGSHPSNSGQAVDWALVDFAQSLTSVSSARNTVSFLRSVYYYVLCTNAVLMPLPNSHCPATRYVGQRVCRVGFFVVLFFRSPLVNFCHLS